MPVIRTLARFIESFVFYSIDFFPDIRTFHAGYRDMPDIRILYWKTVALYHIFYAGYKNMFLDNEYRLEEHTGSKNHRLKMVLIYTYIMYVGYTNIFSTPKSILISDIHCIRHAGYKNMPEIRTLYAIPNDVLITGIHCIYVMGDVGDSMIYGFSSSFFIDCGELYGTNK